MDLSTSSSSSSSQSSFQSSSRSSPIQEPEPIASTSTYPYHTTGSSSSSSKRKSFKPQRVVEGSENLPPTPESTSEESSRDEQLDIMDCSQSSGRKRRSAPVPEGQKDESYRAKRAKNNMSAKKCRDNKKAQEIEIARRVIELQTILIRLDAENNLLRAEFERLTQIVQARNLLPKPPGPQ